MRTSKGKLAREIKDNLFHRWVEAGQNMLRKAEEAPEQEARQALADYNATRTYRASQWI